MSTPEGGFRFVVLGDPVAHSLSPVMHTAALEALGIPGHYTARRVNDLEMADAADEVRSGRLHGANITMPHKRRAAELSDSLAPEAARANSVNTWVGERGHVRGHTTDVTGIRAVIDRAGLPDGPAVILGSGGAAAAAVIALEGRPLTVIARRPQAAAAMASDCGVEVEVLGWDATAPPGLVLNCTSVGMQGESLPTRMIKAATGFLEMVYASGPTRAEALAREACIPVAGGLELLAAQAEVSFELWTGTTPPLGIMYGSVDKYLKAPDGGAES